MCAKTKKVILTIGIPGSGKTTWCRDFLSKNPEWVRVSRDDFRYMLRNSPVLDSRGEDLISDLVFKTARAALQKGFHVIIDNTHCRIRYITQAIVKLGDLADIDFQYFDVPVDVCVERDALRAKKVGEPLIRSMSEKLNTMLESFDFKPYKKRNKIIPDYTSTWEAGLPPAYIFDIDGTLAHMGEKRGPFEWQKVDLDEVDFVMRKQFILHKSLGQKIIVVTGRDESCRELTMEWLKSHDLDCDALFMRPEKDYRKDSEIKKEIFEKEIKGKYNIQMVYDDRDQVVKIWRDLGIKCAQVEPGDF